MIRFRSIALGGLFLALALAPSEAARAGFTTGTLYYSTFNPDRNSRIHSVDYTYTPGGSPALTLTTRKDIADTPGSDGLVFTSDGKLAVGGQGNAVYKVNPATGSFTSHTAGGTEAFHMMVGPNGNIYSSGIPGTPAVYNSTLTNNGTAINYAGGADSAIDTIVWDSNGNAYYTSSSAGGVGDFGKLNLNLTSHTFTTTRLLTNIAGPHGGTFDAYTGDILLFGDNTILQIDPSHPSVILHQKTFSGAAFDQGTVDGQGHVFVANNNGDLLFLDISNSRNVAAADFTYLQFLDGSLDDVAPLSGFGSLTPTAPEPGSLFLLATGSFGLLGLLRRRRDRASA